MHPGVETRGDEYRRRLPLLVPDFASERDVLTESTRYRLVSPFDGDGLASTFTVSRMDAALRGAEKVMNRVQHEAEGFMDMVWQSAWDRASCGDFVRG